MDKKTGKKTDKREKLRALNEVILMQYKNALDVILWYVQRNTDLYSAGVDDDLNSVRTETMEGFQKWVCSMIDAHDKMSTGNKSKGNIF